MAFLDKGIMRKKRRLGEDMSLQITSMADIFMILLVFLLKNYAVSITDYSPTEQTRLPVGEGKASLKDVVKLEISPEAIMVDQKVVVKLGTPQSGSSDANNFAPYEALSKELTASRKLLPKESTDANLLVLADEKVPYSTLRRVLGSAAVAGFVDLQLAVIQSE